MEVQVEVAGPCKRKITVSVPADKVKGKFDENYENLRKSLELPGFRRGHVPRTLMERRFGEDVAKDVRQALLEESYQEAVKQNKLEVVGPPKFPEDLPALSTETPFAYSVTVEVRPEFTLPDYTRISLKKASVEPTEQELQERLDFYRHRSATVNVIDGPAEADDFTVADVDFKVGGESIWKRENLSIGTKSEAVAGVPVPTLGAEMVGARAGDVKSFEGTIPDTFHLDAHRGKPVTIAVEVKEVRRPVLPEATDEWAKQLGFDSMAEFKEELKKQISRMKESESREDLRVQIRDQLSAMVEMQLPEDLMKRVTEENEQRRRLILQYQGLNQDEIEKRMAQHPGESKETNEKNVKLYFILDAIAKAQTILVTEEELRSRVEQLAINYGVEADTLWESMDKEGRLDSLRKEMLDEKIVDFLIEKAGVEQAPREG